MNCLNKPTGSLLFRMPSHTSLCVREFLAKHNVATLPQPPYSPDLAPADFLFPKVKNVLKGRRFEAIQAAMTTALKEIPVEGFEGTYRAGRVGGKNV